MASISVRAVVFVAFPFSDLTSSKLRPALVQVGMLSTQRHSSIISQIQQILQDGK